MKVSVIGTGYVGLVTGTCFAEMGHDVTCIDIDQRKIDTLNRGECPIYEPGLIELIKRNVSAKRLHFSNNYESVKKAKTVFLAVGTPSSADGQADLKYLKDATTQVAKEISDGAIVVIKSTVPVGTHKVINDLLASNTKKKFSVVNNPEFLKEGSAVDDFMRPDRVVIGYSDVAAAETMEELYAPLVRQGNPIFKMSNISAEMTKYAANCFLATKISFINEVARLCDLTGADIEEVRKGITSDKRIGQHFLYAGPGYGGSCFPKDVKALMYTAKENGMKLSIIEAVEDVNDSQKVYMFQKIKKHFDNNLKDRTFTFWGVAFKPDTDDIREAPAIYMADALINAGAKVQFFDPVAAKNYKDWMENVLGHKDKISSFDDKYEALKGSSGLVIMTEWKEFRFPEFELVKENLKEKVIFDARNIYNPDKIKELGFLYFGIGKQSRKK